MPSHHGQPDSQDPPSTEPEYLEYPSTIGGGYTDMDNYMMFKATDFKSQRRTLNIALYIPGGALNTSYKSEYESVALGGMGATAGKVAEAVEKAATTNAEFSVDTFMDIMGAQTAGMQSEMNSVVMLKGAEKASGLMGEGTKTIMEKATGAVLNPFLTAAYKGPSDMRSHDFDFKMQPQNVSESKNCMRIVNAFKKAMLPSHAGGDSATAPSMLFGYPDTFTITFYINGSPLPSSAENPMFNIGKSVLTACELNFDTENVPLFFDGTQYPVSISMKLSFMEVDIMYREKVDHGM